MPIYSYFCKDCGTFDKMRSIADYQKPASCPSCGQTCDRQITAVQLNLMPSGRRTAHRLNEKSAHEPRIKGGHPGHHEHPGSHGCAHHAGCGHQHKHGTAPTPGTGSRPWQVGH